MLRPGDVAPSFTLHDDGGLPVSLEDFRGRPVILYFYPRDATPSCTVEACGFRDAWQELQRRGAVVLGISPDSAASHARFRQKYQLPFPLLADTDHRVASQYGVWGPKSLFGLRYHGILRTTLVIDGTGVVRHVFEKVRSRGHADQIVAVLDGLI